MTGPCAAPVTVVEVDYLDPNHGRDLLELLDIYARDPAGGGTPLPAAVKTGLLKKLAEFPTAFSFLAYRGDAGAVGFANCFLSFSTFYAKPLVNIHDLAVRPGQRRAGVARGLLKAIEDYARLKSCCKLTLEVLDRNHTALAAYRSFGFAPYQLSSDQGTALFFHKVLSVSS